MIEVMCERCGQPADAERVDVSTYNQPGQWLWGRITCRTVGCVDEDGNNACLPPDQPGQLTREDQIWLRRHRRLADEYGRAARNLMEAM